MDALRGREAFGDNPWSEGSGSRMRTVGVLLAVLAVLGMAVFAGRVTAPAPTVHRVYVPVTLAPGSTKVQDGVPVGYERTKTGAVNAGTAYATTLNGPMLMDKDQLRKAAAVIASDGYRDALVGAGDKNIQALNSAYGLSTDARLGVTAAIRYIPIAFNVESFDDSKARVSIWGVWVVAQENVLAPQQNWTTSTIGLAWEHSDWKVASATSRPGPVPQPQQGQNFQSSPLPAELTKYQPYQHVSG